MIQLYGGDIQAPGQGDMFVRHVVSDTSQTEVSVIAWRTCKDPNLTGQAKPTESDPVVASRKRNSKPPVIPAALHDRQVLLTPFLLPCTLLPQ